LHILAPDICLLGGVPKGLFPNVLLVFQQALEDVELVPDILDLPEFFYFLANGIIWIVRLLKIYRFRRSKLILIAIVNSILEFEEELCFRVRLRTFG
jgi:hypothetical protein